MTHNRYVVAQLSQPDMKGYNPYPHGPAPRQRKNILAQRSRRNKAEARRQIREVVLAGQRARAAAEANPAPLSSWTVARLREWATALGLKVTTKTKKADLVRQIEAEA